MPEVEWTEAQRWAIEDEGGALLVSAAAGSGKTAVLVERAVRLITREENPVDAGRLLLLTFTNPAAQELRARIADRLDKHLRRHPEQAAFLRRQQLQLRRAFIGTIDAFCQQLVREHFTALDLPPDITIGERAVLDELRDAALDAAMEEMYADEDFAAFAGLYGQARSDDAAAQAVWALAQDVQVTPRPQQTLDAYTEMYQAGVPLAQTVWGKQLLARAAAALAEAANALREAALLALQEDALAPYALALEKDIAAIEQLGQLVADGHWDDAGRAVLAFRPGRFPGVKTEPGTTEAILKAQIQQIKTGVKAKIFDGELKKYCFICTEAEFEADRAAAGPMVAALCRATRLFLENWMAAKREERVLDHSDFEHFALRLLQSEDGERTPLADAVAARYAVVMVDEYQDTNELQNALYQCLAAPDGGNLFFVGDVKQSIYRFRKANPGIFLAKKQAWAAYQPQQPSHPCRIDLGHNFRSAPGVIDAVNDVFGQLMSPVLGEVAYGEAERLICKRRCEVDSGLSLHVVDGGRAEDEAAFVAGRIAAMMAEEAPVQEDNGTRRCTWDDFCILLRARSDLPVFAAALEAAGVPFVADVTESLLQTPEVLPLVAVLCALDNPGDDVNLTAALLGPLFRFSADEVAALRAHSPRGRMWAALQADESEKTGRFLARFAYFRALAGQLPVGRLCEELVNQTGYLAAVAAMEGGVARRDNLARFMGWAAAVGESGRGGLAGFVRLLAGGRGPEPPAARRVPDHVAVMTIHKSKGLEFPFVFLAQAARQFRVKSWRDRVQMHPELGVGLLLRAGDSLYPTLPAAAIRCRVAMEEKSEEMRLLYVALTRAKQQVVVSFAAADATTLLEKQAAVRHHSAFSLSMQGSMAAWLLAVVLRHSSGIAWLKGLGITPPPPRAEEGRYHLAIERLAATPTPDEKPAFALTAQPDEALARALAQSFEQVPALQPLAQVPVKMSVSALAKAAEGSLRRRPSFMYGSGLSAAERGTAQHSFMQYASFAAAKRDAAAECRRLVEEGYLSAAAGEAVDLAGVAAFLSSSLYARIEAAQQVLREYDFITSVPAGRVQSELPPALAARPVLVQGIADLVLVHGGEVEIVDYKTDRQVTAEALAQRYRPQLALYKEAVERRLGLPVRRLTIWAFALAAEVDIDAAPAADA